MAKQIAEQVIKHIDADEIITKLISEISPQDIADWLKAKYSGQKELTISKKNLQIFKDEYLDFYSIVREDLLKTSLSLSSNSSAMEEIQGNDAYKNKLMEIADKELDIKTIVKKLVVSISFRAEQVFDEIIQDPRNHRGDKVMIEWFTLLLNTLERFDLIHNGPQDQINIQNNNTVNIQLVDSHINMMYNLIKEILSQLDYETSLLFTELFTKKLAELKIDEQILMPTEKRLEAAYIIEGEVKEKLDI